MAGDGSGDRGRSEGNLREGDADVSRAVSHPRQPLGYIIESLNPTEAERRELVYRLAEMRYRKTLETYL